MSTNARLSLIGLYNYMPTLFDALILPDGYNKETFVNSLLLEHGEKCVMYSDPDFMYAAIGVWGKKWELELTKIYEALTAKYDPIFNYDRYEEIEDGRTKAYTSKVVGSRKTTDKPDYTDTTTHNETDIASHNETNNRTINGTETTTTNGTNEHTVSADNSSAYQADSKDLITNSDHTTTNSTDNQTVNGSNNQTVNASNNRRVQGTTQDLSETTGTDTSDSESENNKHTAHLYGNIGVTTSAQMVTEVLKQRFTYNLYATATRLFANELLIGIY